MVLLFLDLLGLVYGLTHGCPWRMFSVPWVSAGVPHCQMERSRGVGCSLTLLTGVCGYLCDHHGQQSDKKVM